MAITKSNKHKLSLDHDKPNEKGGCILATPYALMRSLIFGLSNLNHPTRLLHSLALQRCFSAEQMSKRPSMDEWDKYLYPLMQNIMVGGQLNKYQGDRMRRSF
jgi:hypothetical protein